MLHSLRFIEPLAGVYKPVITQPSKMVYLLSICVLLYVWFGQVP